MATCFRNSTGLLLGAISLPSYPMPRSPSPHTVTGPMPASRGFLIPWGRCVTPVPHPCPSPVPPSHPSSRVYTPLGCQQPRGAGPQDPHPSGDRFVLLAWVAPIHSPSSAQSAHSPPHVPVRVVWLLFPCHGTFLFWHKNTACPGGCGLAGMPLHVPPLGLGRVLCSVFCMLTPPAVLPSLTSSCIPPMAHCPSGVCPSPLMAKGSSFCWSPHTWLARAALCVICALGHAGWAAHVFRPCLGTRTQRVFFFLVCGCGLPGTPPHLPLLGRGWMECSAVVPRLRRGVHVDALFVVCVSQPLV